jgi:hypothetical protein
MEEEVCWAYDKDCYSKCPRPDINCPRITNAQLSGQTPPPDITKIIYTFEEEEN